MAHCSLCSRDFGSIQSLNQHKTASVSHKHRQNQQRNKLNPVYVNDQHDRGLDHSSRRREQSPRQSSRLSNTTARYEGEEPAAVATVFTSAMRLRFRSPSPEMVAQRTKSTLSSDIIRSIIEATARLLPVDNTTDGVAARRHRDRERAARAQQAEIDFVDHFHRKGCQFMTENELKREAFVHNRVLRATPDISFSESVVVCGHRCLWIEYKHYFGFSKNLFVAAKERCQVQKYATQIGPGMIVYALGFERDHLRVENVQVMREIDVVEGLNL